MNGLDVAIVSLVLVFAAIGALRGGIAEGLSLLVWTLAAVGAWVFGDLVGTWFEARVGDALLREILAFVVVFAVAFAVLTVIALLLRRFVFVTPLTRGGRIVGGLLGATRGVAVALAIVLLAGLTAFPQTPWWRESSLATIVQPLALKVSALLPTDVARQFGYH